MNTLRRVAGYCIIFSYIWAVLEMPVVAYALTGREIVQSQGESVEIHKALPFATKIHVVTKSETIAKLCRRYNISMAGFAKLNKGRLVHGAQQKLQIGSAVIVPVKPLSDAMSRSFDKGENNALSYVSQSATILSNSAGTKERNLAAKRALLDEASEALAAKASSFLNQYGTAQISLVGDDKFSFANSQFAVLLPLYDKDRYNFFVQASYHKQDKRSIGNFGLGERYFANDYMVGANAFFDYDYSRHLKRYGFGAEYGRDYLKAAANVYLGQSGWHKGYDFAKLVERPARGWDVRLQSYLPSAPQLGGKLMFEQYYGDKVALFDKDNLQKDPYAVTVGLDYTPVPLLSFDIDYKRGKESKHAVRLGLNMNYRFGVPLNEQLNPANVSIMRSLAGSRYDLVDRNNDIILEYKQAPGIEVLAPTSLAISAKSAAPIQLATAGANLLNQATPVADPAEIAKYHIQRVGNDIEFDAYVESNKVDLTNVTLTPTADVTYVKQGGAFETVGGLDRKPHRIVQHMKLSAPKEDSVTPGPFPMHLSVTAGSYKAGATINVKVKAAHDADRSLSVDKETLISNSENAVEAKASITYKYKKPQSDTQKKACFSIIVPGSQAPSDCTLGGIANSTVREDTTGNVVTATSTLIFTKGFVKKFVKEHLGKDGVLYTLVPYDVSGAQNLTAHPEAAQEFMLKAYDPKELDANKSELNMDPANDPYVVGTDIKLTFVPKNAAGEDLNLTNLNFKLVDKNGQGVGLKIIASGAPNLNKATITPKEGDDGVYTIQVLSAGKVVYTKELTIVPKAPEPKEVTQNPTFIDIAKFKAGELKPKISIAGMTIEHPELLTLDSREGQGIKLGAFTKKDKLLEAEVTSDGTKPKDAYHAILKYNGVALSSKIYEVLSFAPAYDILPFLVPVNTNTTTRVYLHVDERVGDKVTAGNAQHVKFKLTVAGNPVAVSQAQVKKLGGLGGAYYATFTSQYAGLAKMTASYKGDVVATESFTITPEPEVDIAHSSLMLSKDTVSPNQTVELRILWHDVHDRHIPGVKELGFVVTDSEHKETRLPATEKGNLYVANYTPKSAGTYTIKATYANFLITDADSAPQFTRTLRVASGAVTFDPNEMDCDIFINNETADDIYVGKPIPVAVKLTRHEDGNPIDVDMSLISLMVNQENAVNIEAFVRKGVGIYTTHVTFNKGGTYKLHLKIGIDGGDALNPKDIEVKVTPPPPPKFPIPSRGFSGITIDVFRPNHYTMHFFPNYGINDPFSASDVKAILPYVHLYVKELGESDDRFKPVNTGFGFHDFNPPPNIVTTDLLDWPGGRTCVFKVTLEDNYGVRFSEKKQHDIIMD